MSAVVAALAVVLGAIFFSWAFSTPGDQIAAAALGGALFGGGLGVLIAEAQS